MLKAGAVIVIVMALAAILGPTITPFDPAQQELPLRLAGPTWRHPFGLDELGRDILARVLAGARISFFVALVVVTVSAGVGRLLIQSIGFRDYPLVQGCILMIAVTYVSMNLITDLLYGFIDPRIRYD